MTIVSPEFHPCQYNDNIIYDLFFFRFEDLLFGYDKEDLNFEYN